MYIGVPLIDLVVMTYLSGSGLSPCHLSQLSVYIRAAEGKLMHLDAVDEAHSDMAPLVMSVVELSNGLEASRSAPGASGTSRRR
jgi:hypothetical protein